MNSYFLFTLPQQLMPSCLTRFTLSLPVGIRHVCALLTCPPLLCTLLMQPPGMQETLRQQGDTGVRSLEAEPPHLWVGLYCLWVGQLIVWAGHWSLLVVRQTEGAGTPA